VDIITVHILHCTKPTTKDKDSDLQKKKLHLQLDAKFAEFEYLATAGLWFKNL